MAVCGPPTARTVAQSDAGRIYAGPPGPAVKFFGCLDETGVSIPLATQITRRDRRVSVQVPRLNGDFAGFAVRSFDRLGRGGTKIRVVNLRTGAGLFSSPRGVGAEGRPRDWTVTDLVVSPRGAAAWLSIDRPDRTKSIVYIHNARDGDSRSTPRPLTRPRSS